MMDIRLSTGRLANRRTKLVSEVKAMKLASRVVALFGEDAAPIIVGDGDGFRVYYYRELIEQTKPRDAEVGQVWRVRVSGQVVPVKLTHVGSKLPSGYIKRARPWFRGVNTRSGREVQGHRSRLRDRLE
jgi:hypothetical protein